MRLKVIIDDLGGVWLGDHEIGSLARSQGQGVIAWDRAENYLGRFRSQNAAVAAIYAEWEKL